MTFSPYLVYRTPCFKYQSSQPRYRLISPFLPAVGTKGKSFAISIAVKKWSIFEISANKSPDIGR